MPGRKAQRPQRRKPRIEEPPGRASNEPDIRDPQPKTPRVSDPPVPGRAPRPVKQPPRR